MRRLILTVLSVIAAGALARGADDLAPIKETAVRLYDQGAYEEARSNLEPLDAARALDGPLLYRLFFCEKAAGHADDARKVLDRAREALEAEVAAAPSLEASFYLANAYSNLGRAADAHEAAHQLTSKIESGAIPAPASGIGQFQLGKLYQDQSRPTEAVAHYRKAVDAFDLVDGRYIGNARWALRFIGNDAMSRADFAASEAALTRLSTMGATEAADWDALAAARVKLGKYALAAAAWKEEVKTDPANGDDAQYAARLAEQAALLAPLPSGVAGGTVFGAMSKTDLESFLKTQSETVVAAQTRASTAMQPADDGKPGAPLDKKVRGEIVETLRKTRPVFVAAALEYAMRHFGIRETVFRDGYAVLIFQERPWEVPPDPAGS
jgi:tetratricopeptide (TPR) repeat protein